MNNCAPKCARALLPWAIKFSAKAWKKARHFDDKFWLYIVTEAASETPQLHRIQNPAVQLAMDDDAFARGFIILEDKWRDRANVQNAESSKTHQISPAQVSLWT